MSKPGTDDGNCTTLNKCGQRAFLQRKIEETDIRLKKNKLLVSVGC